MSKAATPRARLGRELHLGIGEILVTREPAVITTVLGSCVAVCLYSVHGDVAGMNHFVLPAPYDASRRAAEPYRFGDLATRTLIQTVCEAAGARISDLRAKVIGGASAGRSPGSLEEVGPQNVAMARQVLREASIPVVAEDVGGHWGRRVHFHSASGRVQIAACQSEDLAPATRPTMVRPTPASSERKRRVLIIDDSPTVRNLLTKVLRQSPRLEVVGAAENPLVAIPLITALKPDVLTLDINMPKMDGLTFLERLMATTPMPVVMITSYSREDGDQVLRALELGAVDYLQKPALSALADTAPVMCEKVEAASLARLAASAKPLGSSSRRHQTALKASTIIAIGASTGGTEAIKQVLTPLPADVPPILIVQHIPPIFSRAFAERLGTLTAFAVKEAEDGDPVRPGSCLVAPGGRQMRVEATPRGLSVRITDEPPVNRHKPSVDVLFTSLAKLASRNAFGIILTGMGADGAQGLLEMKEAGAHTLAQDEASCTVFGMPKEAIRLGAASEVRPLDQIASVLMQRLAMR